MLLQSSTARGRLKPYICPWCHSFEKHGAELLLVSDLLGSLQDVHNTSELHLET